MEDKDAEYIELQDDNHGNGKRLPAIEDHVGEQLQCEAEVTQEHIRQLREIVARQTVALDIVRKALLKVLPEDDRDMVSLTEMVDFEPFPWIE